MTETAFEKLLNDSGMKRNVIAERMGLTRSGFYRKQKHTKISSEEISDGRKYSLLFLYDKV
ncbi:hypothetical protein ACJBXD_08810, partial [Streptococcus suis]